MFQLCVVICAGDMELKHQVPSSKDSRSLVGHKIVHIIVESCRCNGATEEELKGET